MSEVDNDISEKIKSRVGQKSSLSECKTRRRDRKYWRTIIKWELTDSRSVTRPYHHKTRKQQ